MFQAAPTYTPPRLVSRANSVVEPAGSGHVLVQVQINADGTFKVVRVIRSDNPGDNAAALDIAAHSTYAPAVRNGQRVKSLFDFQVVFGAQSVSGVGGQIASMLHQNDFNGAKAAATQALAQSPDNKLVLAQLGVADAFLHDIPGAVEAFDKAGTIPDLYQSVAMQAYSLNAVAIAPSQPQVALTQAQRAVDLHGDYGAYYALGVAQYANKNNAQALAALQKAQSMAQSASPPADKRTMANIDEEMLAVAQAMGDTATVQKISADMSKMDPAYAGKLMAYTIDLQATAAQNRHDFNSAISLYEKAAAADPQWAAGTEYTKAAIVLATEPIPNYQAARVEAEKAIAAAPNYAIAFFIAAVATGQYAVAEGNASQLQDSTDYANKAAALADAAGDTKLAASARFFAKNHVLDTNLAFWSTQLSVNPSAYSPSQRSAGITQGPSH